MSPVLNEYLSRIEQVLEQQLSSAETPARLQQSMQHSTLDGGKRVRALLVYSAGLAVDAPLKRLDSVAAAVECVHAYSLIHDDLPAMDNDKLRRGKPTNHIAFDDATAILAGDALLTLAFEMLCSPSADLSAEQSRALVLLLARAAGRNGMVGGQMLDITATGQKLQRADLEAMHRAKTGALIKASVLAGATCSDYIDQKKLTALAEYADNLGLAFQVVDDILDVEASTQQLGKQSGADAALGKSTYPALLGLAESKSLAEKLYRQAVVSLAPIGDNTVFLREMAELVIKRSH